MILMNISFGIHYIEIKSFEKKLSRNFEKDKKKI